MQYAGVVFSLLDFVKVDKKWFRATKIKVDQNSKVTLKKSKSKEYQLLNLYSTYNYFNCCFICFMKNQKNDH